MTAVRRLAIQLYMVKVNCHRFNLVNHYRRENDCVSLAAQGAMPIRLLDRMWQVEASGVTLSGVLIQSDAHNE